MFINLGYSMWLYYSITWERKLFSINDDYELGWKNKIAYTIIGLTIWNAKYWKSYNFGFHKRNETKLNFGKWWNW